MTDSRMTLTAPARSGGWKLVGALLWTGLLATSAGCGAEQTDPLELGQMKMPLSAISSKGAQYRLVGRFRIGSEGAGNSTYQSEDFDGAIVLDLDPALYTVELLANYTLEKMVEGTYYEVPDKVVLGSSNPVYMSIVAGEVTPVVFRFGVGDDAIAFGQGLAQISIQVDDGIPDQPTAPPFPGGGFPGGGGGMDTDPPAGLDAGGGAGGGGFPGGGGDGNAPVPEPTEDDSCPPVLYPEDGVCDDSSECSLAGDPDCEGLLFP